MMNRPRRMARDDKVFSKYEISRNKSRAQKETIDDIMDTI